MQTAGEAGVPSTISIWGILNVTPDSFSDGGLFDSFHSALGHARRMCEQGADVIDVGGESSRPRGKDYGEGACEVPADEELRRVLPVVEALIAEGIAVSVDTVKADVAQACLAAGAAYINDVSGGCSSSKALLDAVAASTAELVLMHNRGKGETDGAATYYGDVVDDVARELWERIDRAVTAGVRPERVWVDPGLGFAKTAAQSMELLARTDELVARLSPHRVLVGASRKSFIARTAPDAGNALPGPDAREGGSVAACVLAALGGCRAVRVHAVRDARQAVRVAQAAQAHRRVRARPGAVSESVGGVDG